MNSCTHQKAGMRDKTLANIKQKQMCITPLFIMPLLLSGCITWIIFSFHVSDVPGDIKSQQNILSTGILKHCLCLWKLIYISPNIRCRYQSVNFLKTFSSILWMDKMQTSSTQILLRSLYRWDHSWTPVEKIMYRCLRRLKKRRALRKTRCCEFEKVYLDHYSRQSTAKVRLICHLESHKSEICQINVNLHQPLSSFMAGNNIWLSSWEDKLIKM